MAEASDWLSVGKSFAQNLAATGSTSTALKLYDRQDMEEQNAHNRKKENHKKKKSSKKEKKHKKEKKERKDKTSLVVSSKPGVYDSSSGFSSSESDSESNRPARKARRLLGESDIVSGDTKLTYLPNGDVVLLPSKESTAEVGSEWRVDRRADRDMLLYEGMHRSDLVRYELLPPAVPYINTGKAVANSLSLAARGTKRALTSTQQYRQTQQRPSGLVVPAVKQHKDYENASKTAQIFLHRQQLLSEQHQEVRLHHKYRYFAPNMRALLHDPAVRRLTMRQSANTSRQQADGSALSAAVSVPLPFIDTSTLCELGLANSNSGREQQTTTDASTGWTTAAEQAQQSVHIQLRDLNQRLREQPQHLPTIIAALIAQDEVAVLQRVASGRVYSALNKSMLRSRNKADVAMDKAAAEKKIHILEQAIRENGDNKLHRRMLTQLLLQELNKAHQLQRAQELLARAVVQSPLDVELRLQNWSQQLGIFASSDHHTLTKGLHRMYAEVAHTAHNAAAAAEILNGSALGQEGSQLQQEFAHWGLQADLLALRVDVLQLHLLLELRTGHTERAVATVQAMLDMLLSGCSDTADYCQCWDSEWARLGEDHSVLPPLYMLRALPQRTRATSVGYCAWAQCGRPAESSGQTQAGTVPDSFHAVFSGLEAAVQGLSAEEAGALNSWRPPLPPPSPTPPLPPPSVVASCSAVDAEEQKLEGAGEGVLNLIAADWFLQQVMGQAERSNSPEVAAAASADVHEAERLEGENEAVVGSSAPATSGGEEDGLVYSRLHGYRIKVSEEPSGQIYRKILGEIAPAKLQDQPEPDPIPARGVATAAPGVLAVTVPDIRDSLYLSYRGHYYASAVQWRPLRALSEADSEAVEQQPERVIFSDDIRPALFLCSLKSSSAMAVEREPALRQRLVLCLLKALGVGFPSSEASHSLVQRAGAVLSERLTSALELCPLADLLSARVLNRGSSTQTGGTSAAVGADRTAVLAALRNASAQSWEICTVEKALLTKHAVCSRHGQDSLLNFIIRLISEILRSYRESETPMFALGFVHMLDCVLVQLLTARYQCELGAGLQDEAAALQHWRTQCRGVIEASVGRHPSMPAVGTLGLWAQYLKAELGLGQTTEALKLADKVLRSLPAATVYEGHAALVRVILQLCLQTADPVGSPGQSQQQRRTAVVSLLVQFAHSGALVSETRETALGGFNPSLGVYGGELKPSKKADKKTGAAVSSKGTAAVAPSAQAVLNAVEIYHSRILGLAQRLQEDVQATDRVTSTQQQAGSVRLLGLEEGAHTSSSGGGEQELCILVELLGWLQQLTCPSATTASRMEVNVFAAAISLLRSILLRNKTTPESATTDTEVGSSKRYSKHLLQLLPRTTAATGRGRSHLSSLSEQALLQGLTLSSSAEVTVVLTLEHLYAAQLRFLLTTHQEAPRCVKVDALSEAAYYAHCDYPCNAWFLQVFTAVSAAQPGGYVHLRAHFKATALQRSLWGGGLTPEECWQVVQLEVTQAHRTAARACSPKLASLQRPIAAERGSAETAAGEAHALQCWPLDAFDRVRTALEYVLSLPAGSQLVGLWEFYIFLEAVCGRRESAKKVFFRAVSQCGWCFSLYAQASGPWLAQTFSSAERASLSGMLEQRGVLGIRQPSQ